LNRRAAEALRKFEVMGANCNEGDAISPYKNAQKVACYTSHLSVSAPLPFKIIYQTTPHLTDGLKIFRGDCVKVKYISLTFGY
jgi:hypothetical protein